MPYKDKEKRKAYIKDWSKQHAIEIAGYRRTYYEDNVHHERDLNLDYIKTHKTDWETYQKKYRWKKMGIDCTPEMYESMLQKQGGECAICHEKPRKPGLCLDHDHRTGQVRGLICHGCNLFLGKIKDNISILESAIEYLKKFQS